MIKEPTLSSNQYAVLMADGATGHVLTLNGDVCRDDESEVFTVFDDIELARAFIKQKQAENDTWELAIYNAAYDCVEQCLAIRWKR